MKKSEETKDVSNKKEVRKTRKADIKQAKKIEKEAIKKEKKALEDKMDVLYKEIKTSKKTKKQDLKDNKGNKEAKKDIKSNFKKSTRETRKEIKKLQRERSEIGKKDTFLRDVKKEMLLVRWPSKAEVVKYSVACLLFIALFAAFFYGIDALFALVKDLID